MSGIVAFSDDVERLIAPRKPFLAFTLGAMGSRAHNFYNDVYRRAGYEDIALEVQDLWFNKRREEAAAHIPDELVLKTNLIVPKTWYENASVCIKLLALTLCALSRMGIRWTSG